MLLGLGLLLAGGALWSAEGAASLSPARAIVVGEGAGLLLLAGAVALAFRCGFSIPDETADRAGTHPYATLFLASFVALFIELMLIRYCNSQIRIFAFYKNVPLIGAYLGLGLGCCLAAGRGRHVLQFLLWLVPLAVFLSAGSFVMGSALGTIASTGSSEHILGDGLPAEVSWGAALANQLAMAAFCVWTLVAITLLFARLGRLLGDAFERVPRLPGYTVNIVGSLAGILAFLAISVLETPPWLWFAAGLLPLLWWLPTGRATATALVLIAVAAMAVFPSVGETVWSRYQKLVAHRLPTPEAGPGSEALLLEISDVFYQIAVDRRPETLARTGEDPMPHYDAIFREIPRPDRVLIVGAGTGNDVAATLRAGAQHVDAVDIDPAIVELGRRWHPERPYDDPRVRVIVDDARHRFRVEPPGSYDVVMFGLLDSHTQLGMSSVRLDNYVFTLESLAEARRLVKPGGSLVITAASFRPWFRERFRALLETAVGGDVIEMRHGAWQTFIGRVTDPSRGWPPPEDVTLPSDDWPFLYLPNRGIPAAYLWVVGCLALASVWVLRWNGLSLERFTSHHGHLFLLGAAFLLMEVHAINRLALLFGTTWLVSGVTIALVLVLVVLANVTTLATRQGVPYPMAYTLLAASLAASFAIDPAMALGGGTSAALAFGLALLSPVYFAGLVFARSFRNVQWAAPAIGANILGSVLGGWIEYSTMALGTRSLVLLAAALYAGSWLMLSGAARVRQGR